MATKPGELRPGSHFTLSIWHPDCWTLDVTEDTDAGLLGHGVYHVEEKVKGRFTVYGESEDAAPRVIVNHEESLHSRRV